MTVGVGGSDFDVEAALDVGVIEEADREPNVGTGFREITLGVELV